MAKMLAFHTSKTWQWGCPVCGDARKTRRQARARDKRQACREVREQTR